MKGSLEEGLDCIARVDKKLVIFDSDNWRYAVVYLGNHVGQAAKGSAKNLVLSDHPILLMYGRVVYGSVVYSIVLIMHPIVHLFLKTLWGWKTSVYRTRFFS